MSSFISPENSWALLSIVVGWAAISIYLEQKYEWASRVSGAIIALVGAMALSNIGIIPLAAPMYDVIWDYAVPIAIPLLMFQCDIKKVWKESGRMLIIFLLGSIGTVAGAFIGFALLKDSIPHLAQVAGMMTGSYVGGGVNLVAVSSSLNTPGDVISATVVADNLLMALYFLALVTIPTLKFFRDRYRHPYVDKVESASTDENKTAAAAYWKGKEVSLKDIAFSIAISIAIVTVSGLLGGFLGNVIPKTNKFMELINTLLSSKYLLISTFTIILVSSMPKFFESINGAQEIGTFLIYLFFVVIGVPASIMMIIQNAPLLLVFCFIMVFTNMLFSFIGGKLLNYSVEEIIIASNTNIGGPTTAAAMAISKGWVDLVGPAMLVGVFGYGIGTYLGLTVGSLLM